MRSRLLLVLVAALPFGLVPAVGSAAPAAVRPVVDRVPLGSAATVGPEGGADVRELRGKRFAMVALRWEGSPPAGMQVQARRLDGRWTDWIELEEQDGPDTGRTAGSEPVWVGDSTAVRVRSAGRDAAELYAVLIDPGVSATDARPGRRTQSAESAADVPRPAVISRAEWGADERVRTDCFAQQGIGVEYASTVKAGVIHHTAGTNDYTAADSARIVRGIYAFHAIDRQWCDIGYNVLVDKYGQIFEGRFGGLDRPVWGAHTGGFNQYTFGVSMLGTFTDVEPPAEQVEAVSQIVAWKLAAYYRDPNGQVKLVSGGGGTSMYPAGAEVTLPTIFAHRDVGHTECPGDLGYQQLPAIRQRVTALMGDWRTSPIYAKWMGSGGDSGVLGGVWEPERDAANGGRWTGFDKGAAVYWSSGSGARYVKGSIRIRWDGFGKERSFLGYPVTDESVTPDGAGRYNHFVNNASIYWSPWTGAYEVHGAIRQAWSRNSWERGPCGYPTTDELPATDGVGRYNHFSPNCAIYWSPWTGAYEVHGAIVNRWAALGRERSYLGYPTSDEFAISGGRRNNFQHGYISWNAATGQVTDRRY